MKMRIWTHTAGTVHLNNAAAITDAGACIGHFITNPLTLR